MVNGGTANAFVSKTGSRHFIGTINVPQIDDDRLRHFLL